MTDAPLYSPADGPPDGAKLTDAIRRRTEAEASALIRYISENHEAIEAGLEPDRPGFQVSGWQEGISVQLLGMMLQKTLGVPVFPFALIHTCALPEPRDLLHDGYIFIIPRPSLMAKHKAMQGHLHIDLTSMTLEALGGWSSLWADAESSGLEQICMIAPDLGLAQYLTFAGERPDKDQAYHMAENEDWPVPVLIQNRMNTHRVGFIEAARLGLADDPRQPGEEPNREEKPFDWGMYRVKLEEWKKITLAKAKEICDSGDKDICRRVIAEVTPGSWQKGLYRDAMKIGGDYFDKNPHFASCHEAEAWAAFLAVEMPEAGRTWEMSIDSTAPFVQGRWEAVGSFLLTNHDIDCRLEGNTLKFTRV